MPFRPPGHKEEYDPIFRSWRDFLEFFFFWGTIIFFIWFFYFRNR